MSAGERTPTPGAVVAIDEGGETDRGRAAFARHGLTPEVFSDGPLSICFLPAADRALHISPRVVCLVEGRLYDPPAATQLASAYEQQGEDVLATIRGEFWALLWDRQLRTGLVIVDQIGSRSPYWALDGRTLIVASELPELLASLSRGPGPDRLALADWLMITGPRPGTTMLAGVHSLAGGHLLRIEAGAPCPERYWEPRYHPPLRMPREEQAGRLHERLAIAVHRRRMGAGGIGVLLSGGLDSSTVAALAAREGPLRAYSAVFPDHPSIDESQLIDRTVQHLGIESTRIVVRGGSTIRGALSYIDAWRVPPTSPNLFFWAPLLERAASDEIELMLDGEGGDELFAFSPYLLADRIRHGRLISALKLSRRWAGEGGPPPRRLLWVRLRLAGLAPLVPAGVDRFARRRLAPPEAPAWLPPEMAQAWLESDDSAFAWKEVSGPRWWAYIVHLVTRGAGPSAVYEQARRRTGLAGITASHPLVDVDVIELALRLDPELAFDLRWGRPMLREAIAGLVPDEVRLRRGKSNFDALFHQLLAGPELAAVKTLLDPARAELRAYVDLASLYQELLKGEPQAHPGGLGRWAIRTWRLVTAECWLRSLADPAATGRLAEELELPPIEPEFEDRSKSSGPV